MTTIDDIQLGIDDLELRAAVRAIAEAEIAPRAKETDETAAFPHEQLRHLADAGMLGILVPEDLGGGGGTKLQYVLAVEEVAKACAATATTFMTQAHGSMPILLAGSRAQQERWIPRVISGEGIGAIALSEPEAGSDLASAGLRARPDGDGYRLDGQKIFITNGGIADLITVIARTGTTEDRHRGLSALQVDGDPAGLVRGAAMKKMGIRGSNTTELFFDGVHVPSTDRLGDEGDGFRIAMGTLDLARMSTAAQGLGIAQRALDEAVEYATGRHQFGQAIARHQGIQFKLADMYGQVQSARQVLYAVARLADAGGAFGPSAALAKVLCSDTAMAVTVEAVQVLGGYGYMTEYEVERLVRDAKITQIYDGTNEINRVVVGRALTADRVRGDR